MAASAILSITEVPALSQPRIIRSVEGGMAKGILCAAMGSVLGLLTGAAVASVPWGANTAVVAQNTAQVSANPAGSGSAASHAVQGNQVMIASVSQTAAAPVLTHASLATSHPHNLMAPIRHAAIKPLALSAVAPEETSALVASASHDADAPAAIVSAPAASASVALAAEAAPRPAVMMIEGDLTVADYDATTGTVETREGRNFSIAQAVNDGNSLAWQDYAGHVHYRCTQAGNCTLSGSGISSGARMI
jgi:hypothetical protein